MLVIANADVLAWRGILREWHDLIREFWGAIIHRESMTIQLDTEGSRDSG